MTRGRLSIYRDDRVVQRPLSWGIDNGTVFLLCGKLTIHWKLDSRSR